MRSILAVLAVLALLSPLWIAWRASCDDGGDAVQPGAAPAIADGPGEAVLVAPAAAAPAARPAAQPEAPSVATPQPAAAAGPQAIQPNVWAAPEHKIVQSATARIQRPDGTVELRPVRVEAVPIFARVGLSRVTPEGLQPVAPQPAGETPGNAPEDASGDGSE